MSRQVDVKALISHVICGDGVNKCRICMGDTSEGQVHLNDTVMMEGDKPVTLSELLETITGVQVLIEGDLPVGLCTECFLFALNAAEFRNSCRKALNQWDITLKLLHTIPIYYRHNNKNKTVLAIMENNQIIVIKDDHVARDTSIPRREIKHLTNVVREENTQCPNCNKLLRNPQKLYNHLKMSTDHKRACYFCGKVMLRDDLVTHIRTHNKQPYDCKKCPAILFTYNQYKQHLKKAHSPGACSCVDCGQTFQSKNAFQAHMSVHNQKSCPSCDKIFRNQICYVYHVKQCCNLDKNRKDTFCTKTKVTIEVQNENSSRKMRVGLRGSAKKECICDYCGKKFAGKKSVTAHIQIVHMKNTHRPCIYCGKFLATAHMTEHVKKHELNSSYTCDHCGIILKTKLGYIQHLRLHTGEKPYACKTCGETFLASSRRSEHMRKVHNSSDIVLKHGCKLCPAKFRLPFRLKKHMKTAHIGQVDDQSFECKECHEKFGSQTGLLHHSRIHQKWAIRLRKTEKTIKLKVYSEPSPNEAS